jgi:ATP-binding cassette subfamily C protein CydCD
VGDLFEGLPTLRAYGTTGAQRARIAKASEAVSRSSTKVLRVAFLSALVLDILGSVAVALVAVPLGLRLLTGSVHLWSALAVLVVAPEVFLPLRRASAEFHDSTEGLAAARKALALIESEQPTRQDSPLGAPGAARSPVPDPGLLPVALRSVTVVVAGRHEPVLEEATLHISPGETVALVGPSGSGKSTAMSLLLGFLSPTSGAVTIGDDDLAGLDGDEWRRKVSYLPEHPTVLNGTLAYNLKLADPSAPDAVLVAALERAGALDFFRELEEGLATPLGDGGRPVSAGERQRIAIARVLLRPRPLYLLDEPTVHLDRECEAEVLESLRKALAGHSALIISHRPAALGIADRVVAVREGRFVTAGTSLFAGAPR